jgi:hypothetical protein
MSGLKALMGSPDRTDTDNLMLRKEGAVARIVLIARFPPVPMPT